MSPILFQFDKYGASAFGDATDLEESALLSRILAPVLAFTALYTNYLYPSAIQARFSLSKLLKEVTLALALGVASGLGLILFGTNIGVLFSAGKVLIGSGTIASFSVLVFIFWLYSVPDAHLKAIKHGQSFQLACLCVVFCIMFSLAGWSFDANGLGGFYMLFSVSLFAFGVLAPWGYILISHRNLETNGSHE
jgi:hypothetical protein